MGSPNSPQCFELNKIVEKNCEHLGVPLLPVRAKGSKAALSFLRLPVDSVTQTLSSPDGKIKENFNLLHKWTDRTGCNHTDLQSPVDALQFAAECVSAGHLFIRHMLDHVKRTSKIIILNKDFHLDFSWKRQYLSKWNWHAFFFWEFSGKTQAPFSYSLTRVTGNPL